MGDGANVLNFLNFLNFWRVRQAGNFTGAIARRLTDSRLPDFHRRNDTIGTLRCSALGTDR
jgi:hypothetical protein